MHRTGLALGLLLCALVVSPAHADPYRWCALGIGDSGASNCYYVTLEQCQAAVSGAGLYCRPNNFYTGPEGAPAPSRRRH
jgi:hypothetical protein